MTTEAQKLLIKLIEQISYDNHPNTLDDDIPDMMNNTTEESLEELVDYIADTYNQYAEREE